MRMRATLKSAEDTYGAQGSYLVDLAASDHPLPGEGDDCIPRTQPVPRLALLARRCLVCDPRQDLNEARHNSLLDCLLIYAGEHSFCRRKGGVGAPSCLQKS